MLVLTRKRDGVIRIGEDVQIVVVEIRGDKVRLGVVAPRSVPVHRQEVYEAIQRGEPRSPREGSPPVERPTAGVAPLSSFIENASQS